VAQKLMDQGFTNVKALLGGFAAWQRANLPVETSSP
jgi:rhodanese-related sulfurtransferase